jgi:acetyltransferase-like isoleucine patch superfamily enzyme
MARSNINILKMLKRIYRKVCIIANAINMRFVAVSRMSWISIGATIHIHPGGTFNIGRGVGIGKNSVIGVLPEAVLTIESGCIIGHNVTIFCADSVRIGENSRVAHNSTIIDHDYNIYDITSGKSIFERDKITDPVSIGKSVWLGADVLILKGVSIGSNSVIGAQTKVLKSVPNDTVVFYRNSAQLMEKSIFLEHG